MLSEINHSGKYFYSVYFVNKNVIKILNYEITNVSSGIKHEIMNYNFLLEGELFLDVQLMIFIF